MTELFIPIHNIKIDYNKINNIIVKYFDDDFIYILYDELLYLRCKKIFKITKKTIIENQKFIDAIDYFISIQVSSYKLIEKKLVDTLTEEINKDIMKKLIKLNGNNI